MATFDAQSTATEVAEHLAAQIRGKTVLITGASPNSLGSQAALTIAKHEPKLLIIAGRSTAKLKEVVNTIQETVPKGQVDVRTLVLDLNSQAAIRKAAQEVNGFGVKIDVLINSAGIMAAPFAKTEDGLESHFGVNHIGHFLFTNLIMSSIKQPGGRIVNITSEGYGACGVRFDDPNFEKIEYNKWLGYGQSKSANVLFALGIGARLKKKGITAFSLHPGVIETGIMRHMSSEDRAMMEGSDITAKSIDGGASTIIMAAFAPDVDDFTGGYWKDCHKSETKEEAPWTKGSDNADKLWSMSEKIVGQEFRY